LPKSRKERSEGKKKKPWQMSKERRKQLLAIFLVLLMIGSALVLMVTYAY
jgi:cell division protein FtsB